jgi:hypothetical protein
MSTLSFRGNADHTAQARRKEETIKKLAYSHQMKHIAYL